VSQGRSKTDRTDAELLWQYGQDHGPGQLLEEDNLGRALKASLSCYAQAQKARIACQELLEALSHDPTTPTGLIEDLREETKRLKAREKRELAHAQALIEKDERARKEFASLFEIPGIGGVTATVLVALFRRYPGTNRKEIVALVGMDPLEYRSGSSVHKKARISKRGDGFVRKILFEATLAAVWFNPAVRKIYRRVKENGRPEKVARMAAARKLLLIAHAVHRSGQPYRALKASGG